MADCRTEAGDTQDTCNILQRKKVEKRREEEGKGKTKGKGRKEKNKKHTKTQLREFVKGPKKSFQCQPSTI